eukprot:3934481-Rhodomonas_salina.1
MLESKTGLDIPDFDLPGGGEENQGGMVIPDFAKKLLEEVGSGKLKMEELPERVRQDLYHFINQELERLGCDLFGGSPGLIVVF